MPRDPLHGLLKRNQTLDLPGGDAEQAARQLDLLHAAEGVCDAPSALGDEDIRLACDALGQGDAAAIALAERLRRYLRG